MQLLQNMMDIPSHKSLVCYSDIAKYNVSVFGASKVIEHLRGGGEAIAPILPCDSIFMRRFREVLMQDDPEPSFASSAAEDKEVSLSGLAEDA
jgi:hypothetical protein